MAGEQEGQLPLKTLETATAPPQEPGLIVPWSPQRWEYGRTDQWEETKEAATGKTCPDAGPSPWCMTTPRWPFDHNGTALARWTLLGLRGWSSQPQAVQSKMDVNT